MLPTYAPARRASRFLLIPVSLVALCLHTVSTTAGSIRSAQFQALAQKFLAEGRATLPPMAYMRFCKSYPDECTVPIEDTPKHLAQTKNGPREQISELRQINHEVNSRIQPIVRLQGAPWQLEATAGDCNTYAVQKRHQLLKAGWPPTVLSLAVVLTSKGEGHLVLVVRTSMGDLVLDNLRDDIRSWNRTGYAWHKIQSSHDASAWVEVAYTDRSVTTLTPREALRPSLPARRTRLADGT